MELRALDAGNLTWRFNSRRLVTFVPAQEHLVAQAWPNWEQMLELHPELAPPIKRHDEALECLSDHVTRYYETLVSHQSVRAALKELVPEGDGPRIFGEDTPDAGAKVVAEYVINNVRRLGPHYSTADFWKQHQERFFAIRELPAVLTLWRAVEKTAMEFRESVVELIAVLKDLRNRLSLSAGVPIVERLAG